MGSEFIHLIRIKGRSTVEFAHNTLLKIINKSKMCRKLANLYKAKISMVGMEENMLQVINNRFNHFEHCSGQVGTAHFLRDVAISKTSAGLQKAVKINKVKTSLLNLNGANDGFETTKNVGSKQLPDTDVCKLIGKQFGFKKYKESKSLTSLDCILKTNFLESTARTTNNALSYMYPMPQQFKNKNLTNKVNSQDSCHTLTFYNTVHTDESSSDNKRMPLENELCPGTIKFMCKKNVIYPVNSDEWITINKKHFKKLFVTNLFPKEGSVTNTFCKTATGKITINIGHKSNEKEVKPHFLFYFEDPSDFNSIATIFKAHLNMPQNKNIDIGSVPYYSQTIVLIRNYLEHVGPKGSVKIIKKKRRLLRQQSINSKYTHGMNLENQEKRNLEKVQFVNQLAFNNLERDVTRALILQHMDTETRLFVESLKGFRLEPEEMHVPIHIKLNLMVGLALITNVFKNITNFSYNLFTESLTCGHGRIPIFDILTRLQNGYKMNTFASNPTLLQRRQCLPFGNDCVGRRMYSKQHNAIQNHMLVVYKPGALVPYIMNFNKPTVYTKTPLPALKKNIVCKSTKDSNSGNRNTVEESKNDPSCDGLDADDDIDKTKLLEINKKTFDKMEDELKSIKIINVSHCAEVPPVDNNSTNKNVSKKKVSAPNTKHDIQLIEDSLTMQESEFKSKTKILQMQDGLKQNQRLKSLENGLLCISPERSTQEHIQKYIVVVLQNLKKQILSSIIHPLSVKNLLFSNLNIHLQQLNICEAPTSSNKVKNQDEADVNTNMWKDTMPIFVVNETPLNYKKRKPFSIFPKVTLWNCYPKMPTISTSTSPKAGKRLKPSIRKYKYETKEVKAYNGNLVKITCLTPILR